MLGKPIPKKLREQMADDPEYSTCLRKVLRDDHECEADPLTGKMIEWEHALYYAGRKVNERGAIIPICWLVHRGGKLNKEVNRWIALNRMTVEEMAKYPNNGWVKEREHLNRKYGIPDFEVKKAPF